MKTIAGVHAGKPVCGVHLDRQFAARGGLVTAQRKIPKGAHKLTGLPVPGAPGYRPGPVGARVAMKIAQAQPCGAVIVWQGGEKDCEYAHVYSRVQMQ